MIMTEEVKAVDFKFEGSKLLVTLDPNKNGKVVLSLVLDLAEVPSEVLALISKK